MDTSVDVHFLVGVCFFLPCVLFSAILGTVWLRPHEATAASEICITESTHAIVLSLEPVTASAATQFERHFEVVDQLALQSSQLAEHITSLNDAVNATMSLAESVTIHAGSLSADTPLSELVEQVRLIANEMTATVRSLRVSTDNMQDQVAQLATSLERATKVSTITSETL